MNERIACLHLKNSVQVNSNSLTSKGQETKLCPCPPVTRSLVWWFAHSFHKQALSETLIPTDPCHARKTLPRPHCPAPANHWGSSSHPHRRSRCPHMKHETGRKLGSKRCTRCRRRPSLCSAQLGMEENCGLSVCQHPHSPGPGMGIRGRSCP